MRELQIQLRSVQDVLDFVALATARPFPIRVSAESHQVNGKSFMEMFCLNLLQPLRLHFQCSDEEYGKLCQDVARFSVV